MNPLETETALTKILIVDDHAETRRMTRFFLRDSPFEFQECDDGADALDCYEAFRPDWILMDWEMKRMNGLAATKRIVKAHPEAQILMVTQYDDEELRRAAIEAGVRGFVLKDDLLSLNSFFKKSSAH
jgi:CheY-like chemotaxis protein